MSEEEMKAIKGLEAAFKRASKVGIKVCGMDGTMYYATNEAFKKGAQLRQKKIKQAPYCEVAEAVSAGIIGSNILNTANCYTDSGGW